jgi:hypothetical protein
VKENDERACGLVRSPRKPERYDLSSARENPKLHHQRKDVENREEERRERENKKKVTAKKKKEKLSLCRDGSKHQYEWAA